MSILVLGDYMEDVYHVGTATRLSPEAPIPVVTITDTFTLPGGAGNVLYNLNELGAPGTGMPMLRKPRKHRLVVGEHQLARWDERDYCEPAVLDGCLAGITAIIISDYGKGSITPELIAKLSTLTLPVYVDTKRDPAPFVPFASAFFPNQSEYDRFNGSYSRASRVIVTRGASGARQLASLRITEECPAFASQVVSVNGAGDTTVAAFVAHELGYVSPSVPCTSLQYAMAAAAVAVSKPYTSTASQSEINAILSSRLPFTHKETA